MLSSQVWVYLLTRTAADNCVVADHTPQLIKQVDELKSEVSGNIDKMAVRLENGLEMMEKMVQGSAGVSSLHNLVS